MKYEINWYNLTGRKEDDRYSVRDLSLVAGLSPVGSVVANNFKTQGEARAWINQKITKAA